MPPEAEYTHTAKARVAEIALRHRFWELVDAGERDVANEVLAVIWFDGAVWTSREMLGTHPELEVPGV